MGWWRDLQFGWRQLWKQPGFTIVAVSALALGIGANTAIFSIIHSALLAPMQFSHPEQLVWVFSSVQGRNVSASVADYLDWKRESKLFSDLQAWSYGDVNLSGEGRPERVRAAWHTPGVDQMVGLTVSLGRDFVPEDIEPGKDHVVILANQLWKRRYGGDPQILGRQIRINRELYTVVGVRSPGMLDRFRDQICFPLVFRPQDINRNAHSLAVMGRLKPGYTVRQAQAEMGSITRRIAEAYPRTNKGWGANVMLYERYVSPGLRQALTLLMATVALVLLIACANVANLLLARGVVRRREITIRLSAGATRAQLFRQFLTESVSLSLLGGVLGAGLAWALIRIFEGTMLRPMLPAEAEPGLNLAVLGFAFAAALLSGLAFGCAPAWQATRLNLSDVLKENAYSTLGGSRHRLQSVLIVAEFAIALTVLTGAGLLIHSLRNLQSVELGFAPEHVLTFSLPLESERFSGSGQTVTWHEGLLEKLNASPGVRRVSASISMPMGPIRFGLPFEISGMPANPGARMGSALQIVTPGYFDTFGIRLLRGRRFTAQDRSGNQHAAIVNEGFVKRFLAGMDPMSKSLIVPDVGSESSAPGRGPTGSVALQIVGIVDDVRSGDLRDLNPPLIYVPFGQLPAPMTEWAIRHAGDPSTIRRTVESIVASIDADLPVDRLMTMEQVLDQSMATQRFGVRVFGAFALLALLLAAAGIYGVMAFTVEQRRHEIGLRIALGAGSGTVLALVLKRALRLTGVGLVFGLVGAYYAQRSLKAGLFGVGSVDLPAFAAVALLLVTVALLASYVPARRAAGVDPMVALREE